jgi:hypothetical protein
VSNINELATLRRIQDGDSFTDTEWDEIYKKNLAKIPQIQLAMLDLVDRWKLSISFWNRILNIGTEVIPQNQLNEAISSLFIVACELGHV